MFLYYQYSKYWRVQNHSTRIKTCNKEAKPMRKTLIILAVFMAAMPNISAAQNSDIILAAQDADCFPLDQGMTWVYDDNNADRIVGVSQIALPEKRTVRTFSFDPYNHEKHIFYRLGAKIFEWRDNNYRLWYDFGANEGDSWKLEWTTVKAEKMEPGSRENMGIHL